MEKPSNRKTWEEEIYWQNFYFAHFSVTLSNDFHHQITLPKKFSDYMRTLLPEQIVLKINRISWNVNIKKGNDDIVLHGNKWEEFVNVYSLKKKDRILFKYNRKDCFEVFLFDGTNLCEKEASYFIRKDHQEKGKISNFDDEDHICKKKENSSKGRKAKESLMSKGYANTFRNQKKNPAKTACARDWSDESDDEEEMEESADEDNSGSEEVIATPNKVAAAREGNSRKRKCNVVKQTSRKKNKGIRELHYKSNRRIVTDQEVESALNKAMEASEHCINPFHVVMRPSCVYKRFFMTIPAAWKPMKVFKSNQEVILKVKEKTWVCKASFNMAAVGFQCGWRDFALDNYLEEYDVCLFVPSVSIDGKYVLDVSIFRVVSEVATPTLAI